MKHWGGVSSLLIWLVACGSPGAARDVHRKEITVVPGPYRGGAMKVASGRSWVLRTPRNVVDVVDHKASIPEGDQVAVAFIDVNGNGLLDTFAEPTAFCAGEPITCVFRETLAYSHRIDQHEPSENHQSYAVMQAFDVDGRVREVVARTSDGVRLQRTSGPYENLMEQPYIVSFCDELEIQDEESPNHEFGFLEPTPMEISAVVERDERDIVITIVSEQPMHRLIAWLRPPGPVGDAQWNSEQADEVVSFRDPTNAKIRVSREQVDRCKGCEFVVQVAAISYEHTIAELSEARLSVSLE